MRQPYLIQDQLAHLLDCEVQVPGKGYVRFTRDQAPGAIPNGARIAKCNTEPGDTYRDGHEGVVIGSLGPIEGLYFYFIAWVDRPELPVGIISSRIKQI